MVKATRNFGNTLKLQIKHLAPLLQKMHPPLTDSLSTHKDLIAPTERGLNVLHIAAFVGDEKIFNLLLDHYAGSIHAKNYDGLGVADYALLGRAQLSRLKDFFPILRKPSIFDEAICWGVESVLATTVSVGSVGYAAVKFLMAADSIVRLDVRKFLDDQMVPWSIYGLNAFIKNELLPPYCASSYKKFYDVDVQRPAAINSLLELERHLLQHQEDYVALNVSCKKGYHFMTNVRKLHFEVLDADDYMTPLIFTLCYKERGKLSAKQASDL